MAPILLSATNADLIFAAAVQWHSIRTRALPGTALDVRCYLDADVPDDMERELHAFADRLSIHLRTVRDDDLPPASRARLHAMARGRHPNWRPAFARLVLPDLLDPDDGRALYLDVDTLVVDDLSDAATLDLGGATVGAVQAPLMAVQGRLGADPYLNSGVLLFDLTRWHAHDASERCAAWVERDRGQSRMADQDALNVVLDPRTGDPRWHPLDPGWNALTPLFVPRGALVYGLPEQIRVLHFSGPLKPWLHADHPFAGLYAQHLQATPFRPLATAGGLFGGRSGHP